MSRKCLKYQLTLPNRLPRINTRTESNTLNTLNGFAEGTAAFTPSDDLEMDYSRTNTTVTESNVLRDTDPPTPYRTSKPRRTVLAVDDDPQIRRLVIRMLPPKRFSVTCVADGEEALKAAAQMNPDIVLLDIHLKGKSDDEGVACLRALRESGYRNRIYMLSSDNSIDQATLAGGLGADGYLVKQGSMTFWKKLETLIDASASGASAYDNLSAPMVSYFSTRGIKHKEVQLLDLVSDGSPRLKEIADILDRKEPTVRKQFERIRKDLRAQDQSELKRMLDGLSRFGKNSEEEDDHK